MSTMFALYFQHCSLNHIWVYWNSNNLHPTTLVYTCKCIRTNINTGSIFLKN